MNMKFFAVIMTEEQVENMKYEYGKQGGTAHATDAEVLEAMIMGDVTGVEPMMVIQVAELNTKGGECDA